MEEPKDIYDFAGKVKPDGKTIDVSADDENLHMRLNFKTRVKYFFMRNTVLITGKLAAVAPEQALEMRRGGRFFGRRLRQRWWGSCLCGRRLGGG